MTALYAALDEAPGGRRLRLTILRGATEQTVDLALAQLDPARAVHPPETAGRAAHDEHVV